MYRSMLGSTLGIHKPVILFAIVLALLVSGCSSARSGHDGMPVGQPAPAPDTLTVAWNVDVGTLHPHLYAPSQMFAQAMVYEPLVDYTANGEIIPRLAESWAIAPDGLSYVFRLRRDVKYSDGSAFDADNAKRNLDAVMANKERHSWMGLVHALEKTEKLDEHSIRLTLNQPYYPLLQELAFVRPFRFLGDAGFPDNGRTNETIARPIGTGPWMLSAYKKDEYAVFSRNDHYWGPKPKLQEVRVNIIPDAETIVTAFEQEQLDMIVGSGLISLDNFKYLAESDAYVTGTSEPLTTRTFIMNSASGPTSDLKVREAIQHGIDKDLLVASVTHGFERKADTLMPRNFPYADIGLQPFAYDASKAERLLDEAGWRLPAGKKVREKDGQPLALELVYVSTDAVQKPMAEIIQAELAKIGIQVLLQGEELMVGNSRLKSGDYHLNFWNTYGVPNDPHNFVSTSTQADTGIHEALLGVPAKPQIDAWGEAIRNGTDDAERQALYTDFFTAIHESAVFYPISYDAMVAVHHKKWEGLTFGATKYDFPFQRLQPAGS